MLLVIGFGASLYFALRHNRSANRQLAIQNATILEQRNDLMELTAKANEATEAKFNFFTNISHEFRTPLTLILGPLEDSLATSSLPHLHRNNLELARKNVHRLLRLVSQLLDFRKINSLLINREILKKHYTSALPMDKRSNASQKTERKFINSFTAVVASNISNEDFGPEDIARELYLSNRVFIARLFLNGIEV